MAEEEIIEVEVNESDIAYYIDDEQGNEIGFAVLEDGQEVEYYYAEPIPAQEVAQASQRLGEGAGEGVAEGLDFAHLKQNVAENAKLAVGTVANVAESAVQKTRSGESFVTRENVANIARDLSGLYRENAGAIKDLKEMSGEVKETLSFLKGFKK